MVTRFHLVFFLCTLLIPAIVFAETVKLEVSPTSGTLDDMFNFTVTVDATMSSSAPVPTGGNEFDLIFVGRSTDVRIINGRMQANTRFSYQLTPKQAGKLTSPGIEIVVGGKQYVADPLEILVEPPQPGQRRNSQNSEQDEIAFRRTVAKRDLYVGEQLISNLEVTSRIPYRDPQFENKTYDGFWVEEFGQPEEFERVIDGVNQSVVRKRAALFPLRDGKVELPAENLIVRVRAKRRRNAPTIFGDDPFDLLFGGSMLQEVRLTAKALSINVKPLPPTPQKFPTASLTSIIVGRTNMQAQFPKGPINIGEGKTLEVTVNSFGNLNPLKTIPLNLGPEFKVYEERPDITMNENSGLIVTKKLFRYTILALGGGTFTIPPIELGYFDPDAGDYRIARTDAIPVSVIGPKFVPPTPEASTAVDPIVPIGTVDAVEPPLQFLPPTTWELVRERISYGTMIYLAAILLGLVSVWFGAGKVRPGRTERRILLSTLDRSTTLEELWLSLGAVLEHKLRIKKDLLTGAALRSVLGNLQIKGNVQFHLLAVVDELEQLRFAGRTELPPELKSRSSAIARQLLKG